MLNLEETFWTLYNVKMMSGVERYEGLDHLLFVIRLFSFLLLVRTFMFNISIYTLITEMTKLTKK